MNSNKEYMVTVWGGAWNENANPSIKKDLGIKEGTYYFQSEKEKDAFCKVLNNPIYKNQGLMIDTKYGAMRHKRTIFVGTFTYKDREYILHYDFGYEYPEDSAVFMFTTGNYACDCNRSLFIRAEYGENVMPELDCGDEIELIGYRFEYED